jgi:hypothetical protein
MRDLLDLLDLKDSLALLDHQELQDLLDLWDPQDLLERLDSKDLLELQVFQDLLDPRDLPVVLELLVTNLIVYWPSTLLVLLVDSKTIGIPFNNSLSPLGH